MNEKFNELKKRKKTHTQNVVRRVVLGSGQGCTSLRETG